MNGKRLSLIGALGVLIMIGVPLWRIASTRKTQDALRALRAGHVECLEVSDGGRASESPRIVRNPEVISAVLRSLQSGGHYEPNHDSHREFEKIITLKPQQLTFRVYQRAPGDASVIVEISMRPEGA
jgi:hypothetical protein